MAGLLREGCDHVVRCFSITPLAKRFPEQWGEAEHGARDEEAAGSPLTGSSPPLEGALSWYRDPDKTPVMSNANSKESVTEGTGSRVTGSSGFVIRSLKIPFHHLW